MEHIHNTLPVPCEKSKIVSLDASIMKSIVVLLIIFWPSVFCLFRFSVKLAFYIAFGSASNVCCLFKAIAITLY